MKTFRFRRGSSRLLGALQRLARRENGVAAVEFSLILPILVLLWIGGVEVTQALSVDRRLNNLASSVGDLVARTGRSGLSYDDIATIFDIAPGALFPYSDTSLTMRVTAVDIDSSGNAKVAWSRADGMSAYADDTQVNTVVPATLRAYHDSQVIMAEVNYSYSPAVGYVITGPLALDDRMFFVPRVVTYVKLCDNSGNNCKS